MTIETITGFAASGGSAPPGVVAACIGPGAGLASIGALHDLERAVATHLFVICANNSGSTFLRKALATSRRTWNLP